MQKLLLSLIILTIFPIFTFAQQDTPINQVLSSNIDELNQKDEERTEEIANLLGFSLPKYTDNPSYIITFKDPSPEKSGVEIDIDEKGFNKISSPYTLPALSIGNHVIKFRFLDETSAVKILEYDLIIIPRAPIPDTPQIKDDSITLSGTALANSDVIFTLSANAFNITDIIETNSEGTWSTTVTPDGGLTDGIYTFTAYTRKYGYASTLSSPVTFTVGETIKTGNEVKETNDIFFSFKSITKENFITVFKNNPDLLILLAGVFVISFLLLSLLRSLISNSKSEKNIKEVEKLIIKNTQKIDDGAKTLREIFGGEKEKTTDVIPEETEDEKSEVKEDDVKTETIINKDVFLKKYKMVDPDDSTGKELKSKKKVKISLTSKEE